MGFLDSVSGAFSSAASVVSTASNITDDFMPDAGDLVEDICDGAGLPEWMGDIGSGVANGMSGNWLAVAADAGDLLGDINELKSGPGEPGLASWMNQLKNADQRLGELCSSVQTLHSRNASSTTFASSASDAAGPSSTGSTQATGGGASTGATGGTAMEKAIEFSKLGNEDFMNQIRDGKLPPEIARDPNAMMMVQQRMQEIQQMNQLMTNMLRSMHDMQMAVIQNIRS